MAINFPNSPSVGQVYEFGDYKYTFDGIKWTSVLKYGLAAAKINSETAPISPEDGLMWYIPSTGKSYIWYEDGTSGQWVEENPSIGAVSHDLLDNRNNIGAHSTTAIQAESGDSVQVELDQHTLINQSSLIAQGYSGNYGFFSKGFTYTVEGDLGISTDGALYKYVGVNSLPVIVELGTDPSSSPSDYQIVVFGSSNEVGLTSERPTTDITAGTYYFDTDLGIPIWYNGSVWIDATGSSV